MQLTESIIISNLKSCNLLHNLSFYSKNLYNLWLYYIKNNLAFKNFDDTKPKEEQEQYLDDDTKQWLRFKDLDKLLKSKSPYWDHIKHNKKGLPLNDYQTLSAQSAQQVLKQLDNNIE